MTNLALRILPGKFLFRPQLRADRIRRDTLVQLAAALREDHDNHVRNALDALIDATKHDLSDNEIDDLVGDIEATGHMEPAAMDLSDGDVGQLAVEAWAALPAAVPDAPSAPVPQPNWIPFTEPQQDRRWSA